jgi:hypothetical protein
LVISCIDDEVAFVDGARENSINPSDAVACPFLLTSSANGIIAGFGSIKWTTFCSLICTTGQDNYNCKAGT